MSQYVCARITSMEGVNLNHFRFDRHNALFFFLMNPNGHLYMRYGGRDSESADSYLNLRSLEKALEKGLQLHNSYRPNREELARLTSNPLYPKDIPMLNARTVGRGRCVECHLIADYQAQQLKIEGKLDRRKTMYQSPDIKNLGIHLDVPKGLVIKSVKGPAKEAGLLPGDTFRKIEGKTVWTFADFQFHYDELDRDREYLDLTVRRSEKDLDFRLKLPKRWWAGNMSFRHWTIEPIVYFSSDPLSKEEKSKRNLPKTSFASKVNHVDMLAELSNFHQLKKGDIIIAVDGKKEDVIANTAELYLKLYKDSGTESKLTVIRGEKKIEMSLFMGRRQFRK